MRSPGPCLQDVSCQCQDLQKLLKGSLLGLSWLKRNLLQDTGQDCVHKNHTILARVCRSILMRNDASTTSNCLCFEFVRDCQNRACTIIMQGTCS